MVDSPAYQVLYSIVCAVRQDEPDPMGGTVALNDLPLPTMGFFVGGAVPTLTFERFVDVDGPMIKRFVESAPSPYVGWWVDDETGKIHIDAVNWYANEFTAAAIARTRRELAIWDISGERELRLVYVEGE